uniref:Uncharacterized protein n=1 Tax=Anguilla anguilla TaxID=7936 RepID=A0A0E9S6Z0_ANGAN
MNTHGAVHRIQTHRKQAPASASLTLRSISKATLCFDLHQQPQQRGWL